MLLAILAAPPPDAPDPAAPPDRVDAAHVTVSLVGEHTVAPAGGGTTLGLHFDLETDWHIYWRNPGDSGEAPRIKAWRVPAGVTPAEAPGPEAIDWPLPSRVPMGPIMNFGYEGAPLLGIPLTLPQSLPADGRVEVEVSWLVCKEDCIPGKARLSRPLAVGDPVPDATWAPRFAAARAARPAEAEATGARTLDGGVELRVRGIEGAPLDFFPAAEGLVDIQQPPTATVGGDAVTMKLRRGELAPERIERVEGLVVGGSGEDRVGWWVATDVGDAPAAAAPPEEVGSLWLAILFAFIGGVVLNLMPCVFPVLSLKILGFVEQADEAPERVRRHGWAFSGGVLAAFWLLSGALIALRAGGEQLGWGFQLQSPTFLVALIALLFALSLSLAGVFEVGTSLTALGGAGGARGGYGGSFVTGALATVVATPCTAPLMGPAIAWGLAQPPLAALAVFTALGAGLAAPYVALAHFPAALARLPRPGPWMEGFKQAMAFPLLATVVWLVDVFAQQTSSDATTRLLAGLLLLGLAAWILGRAQRLGRTGPPRLVAAVLAGGIGLGVAVMAAQPVTEDAFWEPWSPERVDELTSQGRPVFVNFTAAWCISCKFNERVVFEEDTVRDAFDAHDVVALKADWTDRNDLIARTLAAHGRQGVPLYLFHPGGAGAPRVLPPILTPTMVLDAIATE